MTEPTLDVLRVLLGEHRAVWGLRIAKETGRPTGTVYPILARLEALGWVQGEWEDAPERSGPRRRLYRLTEGAAQLAAETIASRDRATRDRATVQTTRPATADGAM